jgi:hypothetical protein
MTVSAAKETASFRRVAGRIKAMIDTVKTAIPVEVYLDPRRPAGSRGASNKVIANRLHSKSGNNPMELTDQAHARIQKDLVKHLTDSILSAFKRKRRISLKTIMLIAASDVVKALRARIISGGLGRNPVGYKAAKRRMVATGRATGQYGNPPPFGIQTGGFLKSIRARVKRS